jgi:maltooligosyltrehalose trehalohydrolase
VSVPASLAPGAHVDASGTTFVVWTTRAREVSVRLFDEQGAPVRTEPLEAQGQGVFTRRLEGVAAGALYKLVLDGDEVPDPYARSLPRGVHGPARVESPGREPALLEPPPAHRWILYELHIGTFSPEGTFRGAIARLDHVVALGATAIEIMPISAFDGARGWGYDGVALYAPHAAYGEPDDLRALVRAAHERGLAVVLDVVYNHFGPSGNYLSRYAEEYFTAAVKTPWGDSPDFALPQMRALVLDNVRYWLEELGIDGLRVDAAHEIHDRSDEHVLHAITRVAHALTPPRRVFFEHEKNDPAVIHELGADGVWADDLHHQIHVLLTGERDGYYAAYEPSVAALVACLREGWSYTGQPYGPWKGAPRGKPARGIAPEQLVTCIQNHDQVGNRAFGTRLSAHVDASTFEAAAMLLLFLPFTPLLFMGQEWGASTPFLYFSDHAGELGQAVSRGRREEFKTFGAFSDPEQRAKIPDPQAESTFLESKLVWEERAREPHGQIFATHQTMLRLRREDPVLSQPSARGELEVTAHGELLDCVRTKRSAARRLLVAFGGDDARVPDAVGWDVLLVRGTYSDGVLGPKSAVLLARS